MEESQVYLRIHYLLALRNASARDRQLMIQYITQGQMNVISEVCFYISQHLIPIMTRDIDYFIRYRLALRLLSSARVSFAVKKRTLQRHHSILPRMLKAFYLTKTIVSVMLANDQ